MHNEDLALPDPVLPVQFFSRSALKELPSGEHRLFIAVLRDAIQCVQKHAYARDRKRQGLYQDAYGWLLSDDSAWPLSFVNVCDVLQMNPDYIRKGLRNWTSRGGTKRKEAHSVAATQPRAVDPARCDRCQRRSKPPRGGRLCLSCQSSYYSYQQKHGKMPVGEFIRNLAYRARRQQD
jgi:hypothetical protein